MKVAHVFSTINDSGGIQNLVLNYLPFLIENNIDNTFIVHGSVDTNLGNKYKKIGAKLISIPTRHKNGFVPYYRALKRTIKNLDYDILHIHIGFKGVLCLFFSKKFHKKAKTIIHIHSNMKKIGIFTRIIKFFCVSYIKKKADYFFSCGDEAAKWFYGTKMCKKGNVFTMTNAINTENFKYNSMKRSEIRKFYGISDSCFVLGHVGTFYEPKNQEFIIKIFNEYHKTNRNSVLMLVGGGKLENKLKEIVYSLNLESCVLFTGVQNNVGDYFSAFDSFLLPSIYEGVPMVAIEAQCSGLPCYLSSNITSEINITNSIRYLDLKNGALFWSKILEEQKLFINREEFYNIVSQSKYNIQIAAQLLIKKYYSIYESINR